MTTAAMGTNCIAAAAVDDAATAAAPAKEAGVATGIIDVAREGGGEGEGEGVHASSIIARPPATRGRTSRPHSSRIKSSEGHPLPPRKEDKDSEEEAAAAEEDVLPMVLAVLDVA